MIKVTAVDLCKLYNESKSKKQKEGKEEGDFVQTRSVVA